MLNENGNKTPALMQKHLTGKRLPEKQERIIKKYLWDATMVSRILQDESYTGTLICHKSERNKINNTDLKKRLLAYAKEYPELCQLTEDDEQGGIQSKSQGKRGKT